MIPRHNPKRDTSEPEIVRAPRGSHIGKFFCSVCKKEKRGKITEGRGKYCSDECRHIGYKTRMIGDDNPNYRGTNNRICIWCNQEYKSYNKYRKYCTSKCFNEMRRKKSIPITKPERPAKITFRAFCRQCGGSIHKDRLFCGNACLSAHIAEKNAASCMHCSKAFSRPKSSKQKYCSYKCHLDSGGARRAGLASADAIMKKYGAKKDANHNEVMEVISQFCAIHDLSSAGYGVPDGLAYVHGSWQLFDIKNPKTSYGKRGLNPVQKKWAKDWRGGPVYLIHDVEEAQQFAKGNFAGLKREGGDGGC